MPSDLLTTIAITIIVGIPTAWIGTLAFPGLTRAASDRWARRSRAASARHADRLTKELGLLRHLHHHDRELFLTILGNLHVLVLLCTLLLLSIMVVASVVANADVHGRMVGYTVLVLTCWSPIRSASRYGSSVIGHANCVPSPRK
jgi:ABC-type sugar transport system permease subunit